MGNTAYQIGKKVFIIIIGNILYALGVAMFVMPSGIIVGGSTGISLTVQHYLNIPVSITIFAINIILFGVGFLVMGRKFALTTLVSTFVYPLIMGVFESIPELGNLTEDPLLSAICGGLLIGGGIGIVISTGSSTGGMDIPPLVMNKKTGIPVSVVMYGFDVTILLVQMLYSDVENILYGIILVLTYSIVLDKVLMAGTSQTQIQIISEKSEEINQYILESIDRGTTLLHAETGYMRTQRALILTVVSNREVVKIKDHIKEIDPKAFLIINRVHEVKGKGFSLSKKHIR